MDKEARTHTVFSAPSVDAAFARSLLGVKLRDLMTQGKGNNAVIAEYILRNPVRSTACSIEEMAELTGTSAPSLSRFARTVGFAGYAALRTGMADSLQGALEPVEKLRELVHRTGAESAGEHPVVAESMDDPAIPEAVRAHNKKAIEASHNRATELLQVKDTKNIHELVTARHTKVVQIQAFMEVIHVILIE
jgi:DNA-binding MurR/RpiR family transcriptional regulator